MKVQQTGLQAQSILKAENNYQFIDGYKSNFTDPGNEIDIRQIGKLFFSSGPKWLDQLFTLRNGIVKFFWTKSAG